MFPVPPVGDTTRLPHLLPTVPEEEPRGWAMLCTGKKSKREGRIDSWISAGLTAEREERTVHTLTVQRGTLPLSGRVTLCD